MLQNNVDKSVQKVSQKGHKKGQKVIKKGAESVTFSRFCPLLTLLEISGRRPTYGGIRRASCVRFMRCVSSQVATRIGSTVGLQTLEPHGGHTPHGNMTFVQD